MYSPEFIDFKRFFPKEIEFREINPRLSDCHQPAYPASFDIHSQTIGFTCKRCTHRKHVCCQFFRWGFQCVCRVDNRKLYSWKSANCREHIDSNSQKSIFMSDDKESSCQTSFFEIEAWSNIPYFDKVFDSIVFCIGSEGDGLAFSIIFLFWTRHTGVKNDRLFLFCRWFNCAKSHKRPHFIKQVASVASCCSEIWGQGPCTIPPPECWD